MDNLVTALGELDAAELNILTEEFFMRADACLHSGRDGWAAVYAAIAVAGVKALEARCAETTPERVFYAKDIKGKQ